MQSEQAEAKSIGATFPNGIYTTSSTTRTQARTHRIHSLLLAVYPECIHTLTVYLNNKTHRHIICYAIRDDDGSVLYIYILVKVNLDV